jgi:hypothetical protein
MPSRATVLALLLAPAAAGGAPSPAQPPAAASPVAEASAAVAGPPAGAPATRKGFALLAGWGYYEVSHLGVSYHANERAAFALFGGYGVGRSEQGATVGAVFSHALFGPLRTLQPGWNLKAIYWRQSDDYYRWQDLSIVLGAYLEKDLGRGLRLALDGGVALTFALESDRQQDFTFGSPTRWNGSVCLEISYRLGGP